MSTNTKPEFDTVGKCLHVSLDPSKDMIAKFMVAAGQHPYELPVTTVTCDEAHAAQKASSRRRNSSGSPTTARKIPTYSEEPSFSVDSENKQPTKKVDDQSAQSALDDDEDGISASLIDFHSRNLLIDSLTTSATSAEKKLAMFPVGCSLQEAFDALTDQDAKVVVIAVCIMLGRDFSYLPQ